jgi:hypothetical protein
VKKIVDTHNQSFFGQSTGLIIQSTSKKESFIFMRFLKKKENGAWEKSSVGEGKTIKCNLEEIVMILEVLKKNSKSWSTVHRFKDEKTPISISWEGESKVWLNVGDYPKMLNFAQIEIFRLLLQHILKEKIEFSTIPDTNKSFSNIGPKVTNQATVKIKSNNDGLVVKEEMNLGGKTMQMVGKITGETEKALLLTVNNGDDVWVPKSIIKSPYNYEMKSNQTFLIDSWFIEKNNLIKSKVS